MNKVRSRRELAELCRKFQAKGKKVVFTNGCFDILHAGHVKYLEEARKLGDILVVGLNSDASVSRLKRGRPINSEEDRMRVLESLSMVDYVTVFGENTPYDLIKALEPDILVKGGDWKKEDIVGSDIVPKTYSIPYFEGISTTGIIEKILKTYK